MSKLDDIDYIKSLDKSDMHHLMTHLPEQIYLGYTEPKIHRPTDLPNHMEEAKHIGENMLWARKDIKQIVICGMGGSAISGDIAAAMFNDILPITVAKDFNLPSMDKNTLLIAISYSGNTNETLCCLRMAMYLTPYIVAITSGGKVKEFVEDNQYSWVEVPADIPPRAAIGYLFFSLLKVLELFEIIPDYTETVNTLVGNLMQKAGSLCFKTDTKMNLAKSSANAIYPKIPIIYSSSPFLYPVANRWKCQINENAKLPAFCNTFPEMCHNEIEAWETKDFADRFIPILLKSFNDKKEYTNLIDIFQKILDSQEISYLEFYGDGDNEMLNVFTLIYLGDLISFYLGILNGVNPTDINFIVKLKKDLSQED